MKLSSIVFKSATEGGWAGKVTLTDAAAQTGDSKKVRRRRPYRAAIAVGSRLRDVLTKE